MIGSLTTHHFDALAARSSRRAPAGARPCRLLPVRGWEQDAPVRYGHRTQPYRQRWGLEPLLDVGELAAYPGVPVSTDYDWRTRGLGPRAYRFAKHLKFALSDVRIWIEQQRDPESPVSPREGDPVSRQRLTIGTLGEIGNLASRY